MLQGRQERSLHIELWAGVAIFLLHLPDAGVEALRRRAAGVLAIFVVHAAVAGAHEQARLGKPFDRAAQMRAIVGKDLELIAEFVVAAEVADVDAGLSRHAVPW